MAGNGTIGSPGAPSFSGYIYRGGGTQFGSSWTSPNFDVFLLDIHAYFDTYNGNGAVGHVCVWTDDSGVSNPLLRDVSVGIIPNGSLTWGGQAWHSASLTPPLFVAANSRLLIGCWCNQNNLISTYDTNPPTWYKVVGTGGAAAFNGATSSGQGPMGSYVTYSKIVRAPSTKMGGGSGGEQATALVAVSSGLVHMGAAGGGIVVPATQVSAGGLVTRMGGSGGLSVPATVVRVPQVRIWRAS